MGLEQCNLAGKSFSKDKMCLTFNLESYFLRKKIATHCLLQFARNWFSCYIVDLNLW